MTEQKPLTKIFGNEKLRRVLIFAGILGIALIFLSDLLPKSSTKSDKKLYDDDISNTEYCSALESKIKKLIAESTGDKNIEVVVTLENSVEYTYATERNNTTNSRKNDKLSGTVENETSDKLEESYIIINTGSGEQPLLLSRQEPTVRGVAVVCDSGANAAVSETVKQQLAVLLDISESRISIAGRPHNQTVK